MRILHTADWHLCDRLRQVNRTDDLKARVEHLAALCHTHHIDVLLVAGDLFYDQATVPQMTEALQHLHLTFADFFARNGTLLAVTGNHDHDARIDLIRQGMRLAAPLPDHRQFQPGRMYLLNQPYFGTLQSASHERAQFVLIPYPTSSRYAEAGDAFRSKDEENRVLHNRVIQEIQHAHRHPAFDPSLPTVLVAHLHVRGAELQSAYQPTERDGVVVDPGSLPTSWAYIALGHIHKPQCLAGLPHVRYPGSLDRLDFAERDDDKGVVLLDLGPTGLRGEPTWLPIPATPMYEVVLANPEADLPGLAARYPDRESAIVRVHVTRNPAGASRHEITKELRRLFPRNPDIRFEPETSEREGSAKGFQEKADVRTTVRDYLEAKLDREEKEDKAAILSLAETFLSEEAVS